MSLNIENSKISRAVDDVVEALGASSPVPEIDTDYEMLLVRLHKAAENVPDTYRTKVAAPFISFLEELGKSRYEKLLSSDQTHSSQLRKLTDVAEAVIQRGEGFRETATHAFQEVVCDLYDGFLEGESTLHVHLVEDQIVPPLTKWGAPGTGPYTWESAQLADFGIDCGIVSLPVTFAEGGLFFWVSLGHEVTGHALVFYKDDARLELQAAVHSALQAEGFDDLLVDYWSSRLEESASDVCGMLNMGPSAGIGLICAFRARNKFLTGSARLSGSAEADNPHPATVLRGYLAAEVAKLLSVSTANDWSTWIASETDKDRSAIHLDGNLVEHAKARYSAEVVAHTLARHKCQAFGDQSLIDVRDWSDADERLVDIAKMDSMPIEMMLGARTVFGSHAVTAAIASVLENEKDIPTAFDSMQKRLRELHVRNPIHTRHSH